PPGPSAPSSSPRRCRHWRWRPPAWRRCGSPGRVRGASARSWLPLSRSQHLVGISGSLYRMQLVSRSPHPHNPFMNDLFSAASGKKSGDYSAKDIEVLEGLEPVRRRPGMYIGGTDERAMHHLVAEVLDNAMDEAVAGQATRIEIDLDDKGFVTVRDNGRGIPI